MVQCADGKLLVCFRASAYITRSWHLVACGCGEFTAYVCTYVCMWSPKASKASKARLVNGAIAPDESHSRCQTIRSFHF